MVAVLSTPGHGAAFTVTIPIASAAAVRDPHLSAVTSARRLDGVRVLLVENDHDGRDVLAEILKDEWALVTAVASAAEAYEALKRQPPDVIICDIGMPQEDGLMFVRRVRSDADPSISSVPAIAVTAYASPQDRVHSLEAGFQFHLAKPVMAADRVTIVAKSRRRTIESSR